MPGTLGKLRHLFSRRNKIQAAGLFVLMVIGSLLEVIGIGAVPFFVGLIADPVRLTSIPMVDRAIAFLGIETQSALVIWGAVFLVVVFAIKNAYRLFLIALQARFTHHRKVELQQRLLRAYLYGPYPYHLGQNSTRLLHTLDSEASRVINSSFSPVLTITMEALVLGMTAVLMLVVEPVISVAVIAMLALVSGLYYRIVRPKLDHFAKTTQKHHRLQFKTVQQGLHGIKDTKVLGREAYFLDQFRTSAYVRARESRHLAVVQATPRMLLESIVLVTILVVSAVLVAQGREPAQIVPVLALLAVAAVRMIPSFNTFVGALSSLKNAEPALDAVYRDLQELEPQLVLPSRKDRSLPFCKAIRFEDVWFRYPGAPRPALAGLSLEIPRGSSVAFVGPSGAGKTTAADVLLGLLRPEQGRVTVDGVDIHTDVRAWQRQIGYVPQHIYLIDDTVRRNVAFGLRDEEISDERVWEALEAAQLRSFVEELPDGLDTLIGERGVRFSGGQRQRVGIARALYHRPTLLVMDEATSALDNLTERYIVEALEQLRGEVTMIVIAHRLTTVERCDMLFMLNQGVLVTKGTYKELIDHSEEFGRMSATTA